jgi:hypothetical protein
MLTAPIQSWQHTLVASPCGRRGKLPVALSYFQQSAFRDKTIEKGKAYPLHVRLFPQGQRQANGLGELRLQVLECVGKGTALVILNQMTG